MTTEKPKILVTGASRGIGAAILASVGASVAHSVGHSSGGGNGLIASDLGKSDGAQELWDATLAQLGSIDVLINNAGIFEENPLDGADWSAKWARTLQINLTASAELCRLAVLHWQERGTGGRIVNISSRGAFRGEPDAPAYGASKAGLNAMGQSLAKILAL